MLQVVEQHQEQAVPGQTEVIPPERMQRTVEQIKDVPVDAVVDEVVHAPKVVQQERQMHTHEEHHIDVPVPMMQEEHVHVPVVQQQERTMHSHVEHHVDISSPHVRPSALKKRRTVAASSNTSGKGTTTAAPWGYWLNVLSDEVEEQGIDIYSLDA